MTSREHPADILDWLNAYEWDHQQPDVAHKEHVYDAWCAICRGDLPRILAALAEWADGRLIDPTTWTRVDARADQAGVDYCTAHTGLRNEDEAACDAVSDCAECEGDGGLDTGDDAEPYVDCPLCGGSGIDPCTLTPLYTLDPPLTREDP